MSISKVLIRLKNQVSTFSILANSPEDVPRVSQAIDSIFANTDAPTKTESEREFALSFQTMMGGVKQFLYGIMAAITFSLLLVMGNTMAMTVRERTKEVGTLKAIGFQRRTITHYFSARLCWLPASAQRLVLLPQRCFSAQWI